MGNHPRQGGLVVELNRPPHFYMDSSNSGGFYQCGDFTEEQQASQIMLAKLVSLESFQNRLAYNNPSFAVPAAMSPPFIQRPASQPNQFVAPTYMNLYQDSNHLGFNMPAARSNFFIPRATPSSSSLQPHRGPASTRLFHSQCTISLPTFASTPKAMDWISVPIPCPRQQPLDRLPDFASPMYSNAGQGETTPVANMAPQFNVPFASAGSTDTSIMGSHAPSPYSSMSPADPLIANHSPPLSSMSHSSSDIYSFSHDQQTSFDDSLSMNDNLYSKHHINYGVSHDSPSFELPMHGLSAHPSPGMGDYSHGMANLDEINSQGMPTGS
ncbi:Homeodomain [Penicillium cf. griseofulvum]|nr:Homeodomain [Penicillium cf. griseofulvum]